MATIHRLGSGTSTCLFFLVLFEITIMFEFVTYKQLETGDSFILTSSFLFLICFFNSSLKGLYKTF